MNKEVLLKTKNELQLQLISLTETQSRKKDKYKFYYDYQLPIHTILGGLVGFGIAHFFKQKTAIKIGSAIACSLAANIYTATQQTKKINEKNAKINDLNRKIEEIDRQLTALN